MTSIRPSDSAAPSGLPPVDAASTDSSTIAGGYDQLDIGYLNRELSWLAFNERVLAMAEDPSVPPLERVRFCAIFSSNLDEFFQVRVAGLHDLVAAGISTPTPDGRSASKQIAEISVIVGDLVERQKRLFVGRLKPVLAELGVVITDAESLSEEDRTLLADRFEQRIFPILTPLAVDLGHPFPYISDLSLNLAVVLDDPRTGQRRFARVKVPNSLDRLVPLPGGRYIPLEQVIVAHLARLFPGMVLREQSLFRVTRNGDLIVEEESAHDLLSAVEMELRRRRFGRAIRLETDESMSAETLDMLLGELDLDEADHFATPGLVDLTGLFMLCDLDLPELLYPAWNAVTEPEIAPPENGPADIFGALRRGDVLVHHPYSSFSNSVVEFIRQAAVDPRVLAIKLTLYRTSGKSPIIDALISAAELGKQVAVLIELKARFDEQVNIDWAKRLEQAGVHVAYGLVGLKIHAKTAMVVREEESGIARYCHIGTGNYNHRTARVYEDFGLLTADVSIGNDLADLFNHLTGYGRDIDYSRLLVAPDSLRPGLMELIAGEVAAPAGRITMKMNSLVDPSIIEALYDASRAGVQIDLIVRGVCCLRPGVPNQSENIRVRSIVGRYLEHSRIYHFAHGSDDGTDLVYIGSADLMPRNLDRRVEALVVVDDPAARAQLLSVLAANLADEKISWRLGADGRYSRLEGGDGRDLHERLQAEATARAHG